MKEIPVLLLTGYLGSGKTTLLNRILSNTQGKKFAVIVNDLGEVNIDAALIEKGGIVGGGDDSLVSLQNGCICCTLKMDLVQQLCDLANAHRFDYIVIEASGICECEPIARTIVSIPFLEGGPVTDTLPRLDCIVTVVDSLRMRDEFACAKDLLRGNIGEEDIENLVIQQIEFCNMVLLNKASEVSADNLGKIRAIVRTLQPKADILACNYGNVPLESLLDTRLFDYDSVAGSAAWISEVESGADIDDDDDDGHHHHHHDEGEAEEYGIGTYVYFSRKPLDINKFDNFIAKKWPAGIIRAKGICYFTDNPDLCYIFEQAGSQISLKSAGQWYATMPEDELRYRLLTDASLQRDWDPVYGDRMQKIVFIGQNLDKDKIKEELDFATA